MIPILLTAATLLLGVVGVLLALRGRRVDDHPICRKCRFDLVGIYPGAEACPECGRMLTKVRTGNRVRRKGLLLASLLVLTLGVVGVGAMGASLFAGPALNPYKPLWVLRMEMLGTRAQRADDALEEVLDRLADDELSEGQIRRLADLALDQHEQRKEPAVFRWVRLLDAMVAQDLLEPDELTRYYRNAIEVQVRARPAIRADDPLPVDITLPTPLCSSGQMMFVRAEILDLRETASGRVIADPKQAQFGLTGRTAAGGRGMSSMRDTITLREIAVGEHELAGTLRVSVMNGWRPDAGVLASFEQPITLRVDVREEDTVELIEPDEPMRRAMVGGLRVKRIRPAPGFTEFAIEHDELPTGGAFRVVLFDDDGNRAASDAIPLVVKAGHAVSSSAIPLKGVDDFLKERTHVHVELVPDPDGARGTTHLTRIYGEPIVIRDVPVQQDTAPGGQ